MSTALDIIKRSLRILGVLSTGEAPASDESNDALIALNMMLGGWNTNKLLVLGISFDEFNLVVNQESYTIGSGGDFNTTVPVYTKAVWLKSDDDIQRPIKLVDSNEWGRLKYVELQGNYPQYAYIDHSYPLKRIYLYPTPSKAKTIVLHNLRQFSEISGLTNEVIAPQGYDRAISYNLAVEIAPEYGKNLTPNIVQIARTSLADIKRVNIVPSRVSLDPYLINRSDSTPLTGVSDQSGDNPYYFADGTDPKDGDARIYNTNGGLYFQIYDEPTDTWNQVGSMYE